MQSNTQSVKYFSKTDNPFVFFIYIFQLRMRPSRVYQLELRLVIRID
jgi:hypothetical protein